MLEKADRRLPLKGTARTQRSRINGGDASIRKRGMRVVRSREDCWTFEDVMV